MVNRNSPSCSNVFILSNSKYTPFPLDSSSLVNRKVSNVFLANLHTSFVKIRSYLSFKPSSIIALKSFLFLVDVPVIPSSVYP